MLNISPLHFLQRTFFYASKNYNNLIYKVLVGSRDTTSLLFRFYSFADYETDIVFCGCPDTCGAGVGTGKRDGGCADDYGAYGRRIGGGG